MTETSALVSFLHVLATALIEQSNKCLLYFSLESH